MKRLSGLYLILMILIGFIPDYSNPIDYKGFHWFLWGSLNTLYLAIITINHKKFILPNNPVILSYLSLLIFSCLSVFASINKIESLVRLTDLYVLGSSLLICYIFLKKNLFNPKLIFWLIFLKLFFELLAVYLQYYSFTSGFMTRFDSNNIQYLLSVYGNKNVTSFALLIQFTILMGFFSYQKNIIIKTLILFMGISTMYILFVISTRAVFVAMIIGVIILFALLLIKYLTSKQLIKLDINLFVLYSFLIISSYTIYNILNDDDFMKVNNRLSSVIEVEEDESVSSRVRFWTHSINSIKERPILGVGIGNWRIYATKFDSNDIFSYVVPYTTHNDFLEIFSETGIFGFLSYVSFFFFIFKRNFKNFIRWIRSDSSPLHVFFLLAIIFFLIDSNLNFPITRPLVQILLVLFIVTNEVLNNNKNKIENEKI